MPQECPVWEGSSGRPQLAHTSVGNRWKDPKPLYHYHSRSGSSHDRDMLSDILGFLVSLCDREHRVSYISVPGVFTYKLQSTLLPLLMQPVPPGLVCGQFLQPQGSAVGEDLTSTSVTPHT